MCPVYVKARWVSTVALLLFLLSAVPAMDALATEGSATLGLTMESSIAMALKNNLLVKGADALRDSAVAKVDEARTSVLPKVALNGSYTRLSEGVPVPLPAPPFFAAGSKNSYDFRLSVSQPLYTGGALPAALRAAQASLSAADLDLEAKRQETAWQVAGAYYGLLTAGRLVSVAEESVAAAEAHLAVVKAGYESGTILKTDVLRTEIAQGQARQNLIRARHGEELARLSFATMLGLPGGVHVGLADPPPQTNPATSLEEDVKLALARRPDLASAREQLQLGRAGVAQAKSGFLPSVALVATDDYKGGALDDLDNSWMVTLNASFSLLDWGAAKARLRQAEDGLSGFEFRVKALEDQIRLEVHQAHQAVTEAEERLPMAEATIRQARENLELTQIRYEAGMATTVDLLDSQALLAQSEANQVQAVYDFNLALARLAKATGEAVGNK
jgi:outer membrane protein TolC